MLGHSASVARSGQVDLITIPPDRSGAPSLRAIRIGERESRPDGLPDAIPFVPGVSACVVYHGVSAFDAFWPAHQVQRPGLDGKLRELLPGPHVILEHPRKFEVVVDGLLSLLRSLRAGDEREPVLVALAAEASAKAAALPEQSDRRDWMTPDALARFWAIFDSVDTPSWLVRRLNDGFEMLCRESRDHGWVPAQPGPIGRPFRGRDRIAFFRMKREYRLIVRSAYGGYCGLRFTADADV